MSFSSTLSLTRYPTRVIRFPLKFWRKSFVFIDIYSDRLHTINGNINTNLMFCTHTRRITHACDWERAAWKRSLIYIGDMLARLCVYVCLWILLQFEVLASLFSKKFSLHSPSGTKHYQFWQPTKWLWQDKIDLSVWMWKMFVCVLYVQHDASACACWTAFKSFLFYLRVCVCAIDLINDNKYILNSHPNLNSFNFISFKLSECE